MSEKEEVVYLDIDELIPPLLTRADVSFDDLVPSIKEHGIIHPIIVRRVENGYRIVAGNRRYMAAKAVGLKKVPCIIKELDDEQELIYTIEENEIRKNLTVRDLYYQVDSIIKMGRKQLLSRLKVPKTRIYRILWLRELPEELRELFLSEKVALRHVDKVHLLVVTFRVPAEKVYNIILKQGPKGLDWLVERAKREKELLEVKKEVIQKIRKENPELINYTKIKLYPDHNRIDVEIRGDSISYWPGRIEKREFLEDLERMIKGDGKEKEIEIEAEQDRIELVDPIKLIRDLLSRALELARKHSPELAQKIEEVLKVAELTSSVV